MFSKACLILATLAHCAAAQSGSLYDGEDFKQIPTCAINAFVSSMKIYNCSTTDVDTSTMSCLCDDHTTDINLAVLTSVDQDCSDNFNIPFDEGCNIFLGNVATLPASDVAPSIQAIEDVVGKATGPGIQLSTPLKKVPSCAYHAFGQSMRNNSCSTTVINADSFKCICDQVGYLTITLDASLNGDIDQNCAGNFSDALYTTCSIYDIDPTSIEINIPDAVPILRSQVGLIPNVGSDGSSTATVAASSTMADTATSAASTTSGSGSATMNSGTPSSSTAAASGSGAAAAGSSTSSAAGAMVTLGLAGQLVAAIAVLV